MLYFSDNADKCLDVSSETFTFVATNNTGKLTDFSFKMSSFVAVNTARKRPDFSSKISTFVCVNAAGDCPNLSANYPVSLCHEHAMENIPTSCQKCPVLLLLTQTETVPTLPVRMSTFVAIETAGKRPDSQFKISRAVDTNKAGKCLEFS